MERLLALRGERLAAGERAIGWKVGFGAPAAMEKLGTTQPLVGFLTDGTLLADGSSAAVGGWTAPMFEAEIAVHVAADLGAGASAQDVREAIGALGPAIELADLDPPPADPEQILAGNIFHRVVILGAPVTEHPPPGEIAARVVRDGEEVARTDTPAALTGDVIEVVRLTAETLAAAGERLRAGEVVITGSVVPPLPVAPGQRLTAELDPLGRLSVQLT
jgi:2-keto-4-pentenoate hydratase